MRLLFGVHQFFPSHYTGTERLALEIAKQMQRMGHSVTVLTYNPGQMEGSEIVDDWMTKRYEFQGVRVIAIRHRSPPEEYSFTIFDSGMQTMIDRILDKEDINLLHILHPMRIGTVAKVARQNGVPLVLTLTDFWLMCPKGIAVTHTGEVCLSSENSEKCVRECYGEAWKERLARRLADTRELLETAGCIVSATDSLRQVFEMSGLASGIRLIPYGEDYAGVKPNLREYSRKSEVTLGFLSTLQPHKGAHVLLEAYNIARKNNIALKIFGDHFGQIDYYRTLQRLAKNHKKTEFCGEYKYEDTPRIYNEIDMIVVPSTWWENSPLVLSRALAHNVPAIVSNLGGMTEVVKDGENGFSFEVNNPESLAHVLRKIGDDPSLLNQLKKQIHRPPRIEEHAFEYEKIYMELGEGNK
ncbi:MAG: glycosyltransferase [Desulfatiglandales bacterium]